MKNRGFLSAGAEKCGAGELAKISKLPFRTALRAQGLPEPPKTEWRKR
jgi:hypothetical protein